MEKKQITAIQNFDNSPMLSNTQTISHSPDKFVIDFKSIVSQFGPNNEPTLTIQHKVVTMDPYMAKTFAKIMNENVKKYEEQFGIIEVPESVKKMQEMQNNFKQDMDLRKNIDTSNNFDRPSYMG